MKFILPLFIALLACNSPKPQTSIPYDASKDSLRFDGENHLRNIRQLTFGGNNAEAYFSFDNKQLIFQSDWDKINPQGCDQIFVMNVDGSLYPNGKRYQIVSTGKGRTTCSYFHPNGNLIYSSTHEANSSCPETVMFAQGRYVWPVYDSYDIYMRESLTSEHTLLISGKGYDAEPTISPDGKYMIFTSTRSGDLELWRYSFETQELKQITNTPGYDGGAFFSHDSKQLVWRASRPEGEDLKNYQNLLKQGFVEPKALNIFISDIDGNNVKQITHLPGANWAPFFHPDNKRILFSSNHHTLAQGGRVFDIFMINPETNELTQITQSGTFDAFPMFSYDGKYLVFASNRRVDKKQSRDTNIFIAEWVD